MKFLDIPVPVEVDVVYDHPNADFLGYVVHKKKKYIVDKRHVLAGNFVVIFPNDTILPVLFCRANNLFEDKVLNYENGRAGFIKQSGRITKERIRGIESSGFIATYEHFWRYAEMVGIELIDFDETVSFSNGSEEKFLRKWHSPEQTKFFIFRNKMKRRGLWMNK